MNLSELRRLAQVYGVRINTNAPGDGIRRFEFVSEEFGVSLGRALGIAHAETWLNGFMAYADKIAVARENPPRKKRLRRPDQFFDSSTDLQWLRDQIDPGLLPEKIGSFGIIGNEDSPDEIHVYASRLPRVTDTYYRLVFRDGEFWFGEEIDPTE